MQERFNVLSLSGGGTRGIYTATVLAEIEKRIAKPISSSVQILCGTSIGGMLATALAAEIPASEILQFFLDNRKRIFPPPSRQDKRRKFFFLPISNRDWRQLGQSRYKPDVLKNLLQSLFGDKKIGDLNHPLIVPAINYTTGKLRAFKTPHNDNFFQDKDVSLVDLCMATSAAPTYFPVHSINSTRYVDGGLVMNNPVVMGIIEAQRVFNKDLQSIHALCIGNMGQERAGNHEQPLDIGYKDWGYGRDLISLSMSVNEQLSEDITKLLLPENHFIKIDKVPTYDQAQLLILDNATDAATEILTSHAKQTSGEMLNRKEVKEFFNLN